MDNQNNTHDSGLQKAEQSFCPNCGHPLEQGSQFCTECGKSVDGSQESSGKGKKSLLDFLPAGLNKKVVGIAAAALVVVLLVIVIASSGGSDWSFYIADGELNFTDFSGKPFQVTDDLLGDSGLSAGDVTGDFAYFLGYYVSLSKDGKHVIYPDKLTDGDSVDLYYRRVGKENKDPVKLDSGVLAYWVNDKFDIVTYVKGEDGTLYQHDLKEKVKIADEVGDLYVSDDGKEIYYTDSEGGLYYVKSGKEPEKLDSDVDFMDGTSDDFDVVWYEKDTDLFKKEQGKDKVKVASDIEDVIQIYEDGKAYYCKVTESEDTGDGLEGAVTDDDIWAEVTSTYKLCYYDGKEETVITDEVGWLDWRVAIDRPVIAYTISDEDGGDDDFYIAIKGTSTLVEQDGISYMRINDEGTMLYFIHDVDEETEIGELRSVKITNSKVRDPEVVDTDVYAGYGRFISETDYVYCKDVSGGDYDREGDMYCDKELVDYDVYLGDRTVTDGKIAYFTDYNSDRGEGTLKLFDGGKSEKVADDVGGFYFTYDDNLVYLWDISSSGKGTLSYYDGKSEKIADDVIGIIPYVNVVG